MNSSVQLQTQIVSQAVDKMDEILNQTMNEKCDNLGQLLKSRSYEMEQMEDECRRMWLKCLLQTCDGLDKTCVGLGFKVPETDYCISKEISYSKQILYACNLMISRMASVCRRLSEYNGRTKKTWMDSIDLITDSLNNWYVGEDSESEYEDN
jgi:hypothetical protein